MSGNLPAQELQSQKSEFVGRGFPFFEERYMSGSPCMVRRVTVSFYTSSSFMTIL